LGGQGLLVMSEVTDPVRVHTRTKSEGKSEVIERKGLLARDEDFVWAAVAQAALEVAMTAAIGAGKGERSETRLSHRGGCYSRSLVTRVGALELPAPQDRLGRFTTEPFERHQGLDKALVGTVAEMSVPGVSTRKLKAVSEALCGHSFLRPRSARSTNRSMPV
jgi:putative transposase